jgi:hypothetical protein
MYSLFKVVSKSRGISMPCKLLITYIFILIQDNKLLAQQNLFNVPSSEITRPNKVFVQQQFNLNNIIQANTTFDYGLKKNMEIGLNLIGVDYAETNKKFFNNDSADIDPFNPLLLANFQKLYVLHERFKIAIGSQNGGNFTIANRPEFATFSYLNSISYFLHEIIRTNFGLYACNKHYAGKGNKVGLMFGSEIKIFSGKLHFVGDCIAGNNAVSTAVLGFVFYPTKNLPISMGWQIPLNPHNKFALIVEVTFIQF